MEQRKLSFAQNASYNTIGTLVNGFCLWLTTLIVVRFSNDYANAGIWQLAISMTNVFATIAGFNLLTYYVSDVKGEFKTSDYLVTQLITCLSSVVICIVYSLACGYHSEQLFCIISYMICRSIESFAGILYGIDQRHYRMDYVGISYSMHGIFDALVFAIALYFTQNLIFAAVGMTVVTVIILLLYDIPKAKQFERLQFAFNKESILKLLKNSVLSVLSVSAITAINTIPRQFLENMYDEETLGYFATVAAPLVAIQVVAIGIFNSILRDLAIAYEKNDIKKLRDIALKVFQLLIVLEVIGLLGAKLVGTFLYTLIYGESIREYCYLMYSLVGCVVMYAGCRSIFSMLIVMRKMKVMAIISIFALLLTVLFSRLLIDKFNLLGTSYSILIAYVTFFVLGLTYVIVDVIKRQPILID